jgi:hypothetical protein
MDIINMLKKEKKQESVFDTIIKKKDEKEKAVIKSSDVEVTQLTPDKAAGPEAKAAEPKEKGVKREFRTEGMHEFDMDSLGTSANQGAKIEYKARISVAIDENKFTEAIELIKELQQKITQ